MELVLKNPTVSARDIRDVGSIPGLGRSPGEGMVTHFSNLAWRIPWILGAWWATTQRVAKSWTQLKWLSMHTYEDSAAPLEKEMATLQYSCQENPMDREPGGRQSVLWQRVGYNWLTNSFHFVRIS